MTKRGLYYRLKLALRHIYSDELWLTWEAKRPEEKTFKVQYIEDTERLLSQVDKESLLFVLEYIKLKAKGKIRSNTNFLSADATLINRARLFETIEIKKDIERVIAREKAEQAKALKNSLKEK